MERTNQRERRFVQHVRDVLTHRKREELDDPSLVCAAVLVPLLCKGDEWHVLVTKRTQTVEHHKGQISFPGGACDADDANLRMTALRETYEEVGIPPESVDVLGALDDFATVTNYAITPFVGVIPHPFVYHPNSNEVEMAIEVPLSFLLENGNLHVEKREFGGSTFDVLAWYYGSHRIWGATARILKGFLDLVR